MSVQASFKAAVMVRLTGLILDNMNGGKVVTIRDLYYQDVELFKHQRMVTSSVNQLCKMLKVYRRDLNIVPAPNGLIAADMTVVFRDEGVHSIQRENGTSIIPVGFEILNFTFFTPPEFILVVEKEAVFTHLYRELPTGIILTGKGFPDHYTRKFLRALVNACPTTPVFGLVDSDVHGLLILRTYKSGSDSGVEECKPIEQIKFLGVRLLDYKVGLVNSTYRDKRLAMSTLGKPWMAGPDYADWRCELQRGMFMGKKAEMNVLDQEHLGRLAQYVKEKIPGHLQAALPQETVMVKYGGRRPKRSPVRFRVISQGLRISPAAKKLEPVVKLEPESDSEPESGTYELLSSELFMEETREVKQEGMPDESDNIDPSLRRVKRQRVQG